MSNQRPPILRLGSKGSEVERLQSDLSRLGYNIGAAGVNGIFDEDTQQAVIAFQKDHNITVDGVVGPQTGQKLGANLMA